MKFACCSKKFFELLNTRLMRARNKGLLALPLSHLLWKKLFSVGGAGEGRVVFRSRYFLRVVFWVLIYEYFTNLTFCIVVFESNVSRSCRPGGDKFSSFEYVRIFRCSYAGSCEEYGRKFKIIL